MMKCDGILCVTDAPMIRANNNKHFKHYPWKLNAFGVETGMKKSERVIKRD